MTNERPIAFLSGIASILDIGYSTQTPKMAKSHREINAQTNRLSSQAFLIAGKSVKEAMNKNAQQQK